MSPKCQLKILGRTSIESCISFADKYQKEEQKIPKEVYHLTTSSSVLTPPHPIRFYQRRAMWQTYFRHRLPIRGPLATNTLPRFLRPSDCLICGLVRITCSSQHVASRVRLPQTLPRQHDFMEHQ